MENFIKDDHYYQGYKYTIENAQNHLESAELIKQICFGQAFAHLVLATEEAVKAMMLFTIAIDPDTLLKVDKGEYFSNHKYKHKEITNIEHGSQLIRQVAEATILPFKDVPNHSLSKSETKEKIKQAHQNVVQLLKDLVDQKKPEIRLDYNKDWWDQADTNKQLGFYIDELSKRKSWKGPKDFNQKRYNKGLKIASAFVEKVTIIESSFEYLEIRELYQELKELEKNG